MAVRTFDVREIKSDELMIYINNHPDATPEDIEIHAQYYTIYNVLTDLQSSSELFGLGDNFKYVTESIKNTLSEIESLFNPLFADGRIPTTDEIMEVRGAIAQKIIDLQQSKTPDGELMFRTSKASSIRRDRDATAKTGITASTVVADVVDIAKNSLADSADHLLRIAHLREFSDLDYVNICGRVDDLNYNAVAIAKARKEGNVAEEQRLLQEREIISHSINIELATGVALRARQSLKDSNLELSKNLKDKETLEKQNNEIKAVTDVFSNANVSVSNEAVIALFQGQINATNTQIKELDNQISSYDSRIRDIDATIRTLEKKVAEGTATETEVLKTKIERDELREKRDELQSQKDGLSKDINNYNERIDFYNDGRHENTINNFYKSVIDGILTSNDPKYSNVKKRIINALESGELSPAEIITELNRAPKGKKSAVQLFLESEEGKKLEPKELQKIASIPNGLEFTVKGTSQKVNDEYLKDVIANVKREGLPFDKLSGLYKADILKAYGVVSKFAQFPPYLPDETIARLKQCYAKIASKAEMTEAELKLLEDYKAYQMIVGDFNAQFVQSREISRVGIAHLGQALVKETALSRLQILGDLKPNTSHMPFLTKDELQKTYTARIASALGLDPEKDKIIIDQITNDVISTITGSTNAKLHDEHVAGLVQEGSAYNKKDPSKNVKIEDYSMQLAQDIVIRQEITMEASLKDNPKVYHEALVANFAGLQTILNDPDQYNKLTDTQKKMLGTIFMMKDGEFVKETLPDGSTTFVTRNDFLKSPEDEKQAALKAMQVFEFVKNEKKMNDLRELKQHPIRNKLKIKKLEKEINQELYSEKEVKEHEKGKNSAKKKASTKPTAACWSSPKAQLKFYEGLLESIYKYQTAVSMGLISPKVPAPEPPKEEPKSLFDEVEETKDLIIVTKREHLEKERRTKLAQKMKNDLMFKMEKKAVGDRIAAIIGAEKKSLLDDVLADGRLNFSKYQAELNLSDSQLKELNMLLGSYRKLDTLTNPEKYGATIIKDGKPVQAGTSIKKEIASVIDIDAADPRYNGGDDYNASKVVASTLNGIASQDYRDAADAFVE